MPQGRFITIDGSEGAGKSLLCKKLYDRFLTFGIPAVLTKEPGGTEKGVEYRRRLLEGGLSTDEELDLFFRDRHEHFQTLVVPALAEGKLIISDRCSPSTIAYQHFGRGVSLDKIQKPDNDARSGLVPDLSLLIDVPVSVGLARVEKRGEAKTTFEKEEIDFHHRVRTGFLHMADPNLLPGWNFHIVSGDRSKEDVLNTCWGIIITEFPELRKKRRR